MDFRETARKRAYRDGVEFVGAVRGTVAGLLVSGAIGVVAAVVVPLDSTLGQALVGASASLVSFGVLSLTTYAFFLVLAPVRQRNEAREALRAYLARGIKFLEPTRHSDLVFLPIRNEGAPDSFYAEVSEVSGLEIDRWTNTPWPMSWKDSEDRGLMILHGASGVLYLGEVHAPSTYVNYRENKRDIDTLAGAVDVQVHGRDRTSRLSAHAAADLAEALRQVLTFAVQVNGSMLNRPARATVRITFGSPRPKTWHNAEPGEMESDFEIAVEQLE